MKIKDTYDDHDIMIVNGILAITCLASCFLILLGMALHVC